MPAISYARENVDTVETDVIPLMILHDTAVSDDITQEWPLEIDIETYKKIEIAGMLRVFTARIDGKLVGYCVYMVMPSIFRKSLVISHENALYVRPENRNSGLALRLKAYAEKQLEIESAMVMYHVPASSPALGTILQRTGYKKYSETFARKF